MKRTQINISIPSDQVRLLHEIASHLRIGRITDLIRDAVNKYVQEHTRQMLPALPICRVCESNGYAIPATYATPWFDDDGDPIGDMCLCDACSNSPPYNLAEKKKLTPAFTYSIVPGSDKSGEG